jgi:hypothetical protein
MVAQYDGIANTSDGKDSSHSTDAGTWANLITGTRFGSATVSSSAGWTDRGYAATNTSQHYRVYVTLSTSKPDSYKSLTDATNPYHSSDYPFTVEWVGQLDSTFETDKNTHLLLYAQSSDNSGSSNLWWMGSDGSSGFGLDYAWKAFDWANTYWNTADFPNAALPEGGTSNIVQFVVIWDGKNLHTEIRTPSGTTIHDSQEGLYDKYRLTTLRALAFQSGNWESTVGSVYSIRYYDGVLSDTQLAANYAIDQVRFLAPPTITLRSVDGSVPDITGISANLVSAINMTFVVPDYENDGSTPIPSGDYYVIYKYQDKETNTGTITISNP